MKEVLLIEDDINKQKEIKAFLESYFNNSCSITENRSFKTGYSSILATNYDLVILDMSMPTFDVGKGEAGGRSRPFAGKEILMRINEKDIDTPIVIVTQFIRFGEKNNYITFKQLEDEIKSKYSRNFLGMIYYRSTSYDWQNELGKILDSIVWRNNENSIG